MSQVHIQADGYTRSVEADALITRADLLEWKGRKTGHAVWSLTQIGDIACDLAGELVDGLGLVANETLVMELQK